MHRRIYEWTIHWARTPRATQALALIAFAESSFFPVPPDVLLVAMCLARPKRSFFYAAVCALFSVLGGMLGYVIGYGLWEAVGPFFFSYVPGFTEGAFNRVASLYQENAFWTVFTSGFVRSPMAHRSAASSPYLTTKPVSSSSPLEAPTTARCRDSASA